MGPAETSDAEEGWAQIDEGIHRCVDGLVAWHWPPASVVKGIFLSPEHQSETGYGEHSNDGLQRQKETCEEE